MEENKTNTNNEQSTVENGITHNYVKLIKNYIYPTYQLYAQMANTRTTPERGMLIAVHTVLEWLANRMGDNVPDDIKEAVEKGEDESILFNKHINEGYSVGIVYLKNKKAWCLQIVEPHLGSNPGEAVQDEQAVPGRIIETDIEFRIVENTLECGFKTIISEPEGLRPAKAYRLAPIKKLINNPDFGLKQVNDLIERPVGIGAKRDVENVVELWKNSENQLPIIIFSFRKEEPEKFTLSSNMPDVVNERIVEHINNVKRKEIEEKELQYDVIKFAKSCVGYGRTYMIIESQHEYLMQQAGIEFRSGEIIVLYPQCHGGDWETRPFVMNDMRRAERVDRFNYEEIHQYPRDKKIDFGHIGFFSIARAILAENVKMLENKLNESDIEQQEQIATIKAQVDDQIKKAEDEIEALNEKISRKNDEIDRHKQDKEVLREEIEKKEEKCKIELKEKDNEIAFLERKLDRSGKLEDLADWSDKYFADKIIFHDRARGMLTGNVSSAIDIDKIYDAVEHLATEFWENRYEGLSEDDVKNRCTLKYNANMNVDINTEETMGQFRNEYNVKYYNSKAGKKINTQLDLHFKYGVDSEYNFRIYFFCDDEKKKIVIGSLPKHLPTREGH